MVRLAFRETPLQLNPKLSPGGFLIVDDYDIADQCQKAIHDYRKKYGITDAIQPIDQSGVFWRKSGLTALSRVATT